MPDTLTFDFIKSNHFRVIHADGAVGAPTPQGLFALNFFSERFPIPQQVTQQISPDGHLGPELPDTRIIRDAVIREVEACVTMSFTTLASLHKFLGDQLEALSKNSAAPK